MRRWSLGIVLMCIAIISRAVPVRADSFDLGKHTNDYGEGLAIEVILRDGVATGYRFLTWDTKFTTVQKLTPRQWARWVTLFRQTQAHRERLLTGYTKDFGDPSTEPSFSYKRHTGGASTLTLWFPPAPPDNVPILISLRNDEVDVVTEMIERAVRFSHREDQ